MSKLQRRAAFWGNQLSNLDYLVNGFERSLGEKWPDNKDKGAIGELLPVLKKALRFTRTHYIGVLMAQTAKDAENTGGSTKNEADEQQKITSDDVVKIIIKKTNQNRKNERKIAQILEAHGITRLTELKPDMYKAFFTDVAAL